MHQLYHPAFLWSKGLYNNVRSVVDSRTHATEYLECPSCHKTYASWDDSIMDQLVSRASMYPLQNNSGLQYKSAEWNKLLTGTFPNYTDQTHVSVNATRSAFVSLFVLTVTPETRERKKKNKEQYQRRTKLITSMAEPLAPSTPEGRSSTPPTPHCDCYRSYFPAALTRKYACDTGIISMLRSRTFGNSPTSARNQIKELQKETRRPKKKKQISMAEPLLPSTPDGGVVVSSTPHLQWTVY